jgi:hypothetical protein
MSVVIILTKNAEVKEFTIQEEIDINSLNVDSWEINTGLGSFERIDYQYNGNIISLYGWKQGHLGEINRTELPPPEDNTLYFGDVVVIRSNNGDVLDLTEQNYNEFYEAIHGGFESLGEEDTDSDSDISDYERNSFIVSDNDEEDNRSTTESEYVNSGGESELS